MLSDVVGVLRCPHCGASLTLSLDGLAVRCGSGHAFDLARQGYLSLLPGSVRVTGDTADMVAARSEFLDAGHFAPLTDAVAAACASVASSSGCVVDLGGGTGHHLAAVLERLPGRTGLVIDVSRHALRRAARAHPAAGAVRCDAWQELPVRSGVAALVLNVFAPRNAAEIHRILRPDGHLVTVTPTAEHLAELVDRLSLLRVDDRKAERLDEALAGRFVAVRTEPCAFGMRLDRAAVRACAAMGPSAWHADPDDLARRVRELPEPVAVTASVTVTTYARV